ncbi:Rnase Y domain-containing protein, partial [bacterium]|nr:Rnase Y domain-containing protein [bacterium]
MIGLVGALLIGIGWAASYAVNRVRLKGAKSQVDEILTEAKKEAEKIKNQVVLKAKEEWYNKRDDFERRLKERQKKLEKLERDFQDKEKKHTLKQNQVSQL